MPDKESDGNADVAVRMAILHGKSLCRACGLQYICYRIQNKALEMSEKN
jgi:hypothetical protein